VLPWHNTIRPCIFLCLRALNYLYIFAVHELRCEQFKFKAEKQKISHRCPGNFLKKSGSLLAQTG
jgi:hypothetical protein